MKIIYHNSSTVSIIENNTRIVCDPWILDGEYYGSWFHYPKYEIDNGIFDCNAIYISHIHGDHLSENSLRKFDKNIPIYIHNYKSPFVKIKLTVIGFKNIIELDHSKSVKIGDIDLTIYSADNCNPELCGKFVGCSKVEDDFEFTQIDSLALFKSRINNKTILNLNDCPFELASEVIKKHFLNKLKINLLLVGYAGAGPYPQCFKFENDDLKLKAAESKKQMFINQAVKFIDLIDPEYYMPFAGTYILGGRNYKLNKFRGVPTRNHALDLIAKNIKTESKGFILKSNNDFNFDKLPDYKIIEKPEKYINDIKDFKYSYEEDELPLFNEIKNLINKSVNRYNNVRESIKYSSNVLLVFEVYDKFIVVSNKKEEFKILNSLEFNKIKKYVKLKMDPRLLKNCMMGPRYGHYDNAEIGSHIEYDRYPNEYERALYYCLNFFHI
tara:strand:- start:11415 stop:12734 length:1320 start_codon:yes stop_codon:yes gene_type:complete